MAIKTFHAIFADEVAAISRRRNTFGRPPIALEEEDHERDGTPISQAVRSVQPTPKRVG